MFCIHKVILSRMLQLKEITEIENKISSEERALERLRSSAAKSQQSSEEADELDEYMSSLSNQGHSMAQKAEISKTKVAYIHIETHAFFLWG